MNSEYWADVKPFLKERNQKYREENYDKRINYAIKKFEENNIEYKLCNEKNGHFNLYLNGKVIMSFWSWTGVIYSPIKETDKDFFRGIKNCIKLYKQLEKKLLGGKENE